MDRLDFKIGVEPKDAPPFTVILVASSRQEKAAWTSDISQVSESPVSESLGPVQGGLLMFLTPEPPGPLQTS